MIVRYIKQLSDSDWNALEQKVKTDGFSSLSALISRKLTKRISQMPACEDCSHGIDIRRTRSLDINLTEEVYNKVSCIAERRRISIQRIITEEIVEPIIYSKE